SWCARAGTTASMRKRRCRRTVDRRSWCRGLVSSAREVGMAQVLLKPVNQSTLFDSVIQMLSDGQESREEGAVQKSTTAADQLARLRGMRILLVEDNEINREVAAGLMDFIGVQVDMAVNGVEAVEQAQLKPYDVMLMDMQM